jgi:hypothetical protein
LNFN